MVLMLQKNHFKNLNLYVMFDLLLNMLVCFHVAFTFSQIHCDRTELYLLHEVQRVPDF